MGKEKALEIVKNLTATINKMKTITRSIVVSQSTAYQPTRANIETLKRQRDALIDKFNLK